MKELPKVRTTRESTGQPGLGQWKLVCDDSIVCVVCGFLETDFLKNVIFSSLEEISLREYKLLPQISLILAAEHRNHSQEWGDSSVGRMLAAQEWGPKFRSLAPTYKPGMVEHAYNPTTESGVQDTYMQILRLCWSAGVAKSMSSRSSERPCLKTKRMKKWLRRTTDANFWAPHPPELVRGSNNTQNVKQWLIKLTVNEITKLEFQCIFSWDSCTQPDCTDFYAVFGFCFI